MATHKLLFLSLLLINTFLTRPCGASYKGCLPENQRERVYDINPGDYDPSAMTTDLCSAKCGAYGKAFAALTYGRFCFCGDTEPQSANVVANSFCQEICTGDATSKCGGKGYVSVYGASQPITGLTISDDASTIVVVNTRVNFDVGVTSGNEVYYQMDYDDGAGLSEKNATGFEFRTFHVPGTYSVRVEANDFNNTLAVQRAVTTVTVQAPVADVDVECDPVFATFKEGRCVATVWQGTGVSFKATVATTSLQHDFPAIADPVLSAVGPGIPSKDSGVSLLDPGHSGTVVAQSSLVGNPGRVIGWELNVKTSGTFKILILSPDCGGNKYCPLDNNCAASCSGAEGVYAVSCSSQPFCPRKRVCDDSTCAAPARFSATTPHIDTYTVKATVDVVAPGTGYQYVAESTLVPVEAGDILALDVGGSAGATLFSVDCLAQETDYTKAGLPGATIAKTDLTATGGNCMALRATVSEGSKVYLPFTFEQENTYTLTVTAKNTGIVSSDATNTTDITVLEGVNFTIISGPEFVKTGVAATFTVEPHTGKSCVYTWDKLGDNSPALVNVSGQTQQLTYPTKGIYNLTVTTANSVSSKTNVTVVVVQDELTGLDVTAPTAALGEAHIFQITLTTGSDYTCTWDYGDGSSVGSTYPNDTPSGATTPIAHTYNTIGDKSVNVTCSNDVSSQTKLLTQKVQERITGLALVQQGQDTQQPVVVPWKVTSGSDIVWVATFQTVTMNVDIAQTSADGYSWQSVSMGNFQSNEYDVAITATNDINSMNIAVKYTLTTAIANFMATASTANTTTGTNIVYTVQMDKGSDVNVTLVYQDGNADSQVYAGDWATATTKTYTHAFADGGRFSVLVSASNAAGTFTETLEVLVLEGVGSIEMFSPDFALYAPPSFIDVWFDVPPGKAAPTEPKLELDFDYKSGKRSYDLVLANNYTEQYDDRGVFSITATVSNSLDSKQFNRTLVIIDVLEGPQIVPAFLKAPKGQPLNVDFVLYRGPKAPYCNLTWDTGDSTQNIQTTSRQGEGMDGKDSLNITYPAVNTYTLRVTATTPLQSVSHSLSMQVVEPVLETSLQVTVDKPNSIWNFADKVKVTVTWTSTIIPDSPKVNLLWGDGTSETNLPFSVNGNGYQQIFEHAFNTDGLTETKVTVFNDASSVEFPLQTGVYKTFDSMATSPCFVPDLPANAGCQNGLNGASTLFSSDKPVHFTITTSNNARATYYDITVENGADITSCNKTTNPFSLEFTKPGTWKVTILAVNPLHQKSIDVTIQIVEEIVGFQFTHNPAEKDAGVAKTFGVSFTTQGLDTCLMVDFGDGNKEVYADNVGACTLDSAFTGMAASGLLTGLTEVSHTYLTQQTYTVIATAKNTYTSVTQTFSLDISGMDCSQPQVTIENATLNFRTPHHFKKGGFINIRGIPRIACDVVTNVKDWIIQTVDKNWGNETGLVDLSTHNVDTSTAQLSLKPWTLDYGLYKVTFSMSMISGDPNLKFTAMSHSYFEVGESELVGLMVSGGASEIVRGISGGGLELKPLDFSYDPDIVDNSPANSSLTVANWTCSYKNGSEPSECAALIADASTGKTGALTATSATMAQLKAGETYRMTVFLLKVDRYVRASVDVVVVAGDPPRVTIICTGGSICHQQTNGFLVLKSAKLSLEAMCDNCNVGDIISYQWKVYLAAYRWPDGWRPLLDRDLDQNRIVGDVSKAFSIQPALFESFPEFNRYKAECTVTLNGVKGWAATHISLNEPPKGGVCTIEPKEMVLSTTEKFRIKCENWSDDTGISEYIFLSYFDPESVKTQITVVRTPQSHVDINVTLSQGAHYLNYSNTVRVVVRDTMGASTEVDIDTVKVTPVPVENVRNVTSGLLNSPNNELTKLFAEGDTISCVEFGTTIAAMLNSDSKRSLTEYQGAAIASTKSATALGPYNQDRKGAYTEATKDLSFEEEKQIETQRDDRARLRTLLLDSLSDLPNNTMLGRTQILSGMSECLRYPDEVTADTQISMMDSLESFAAKLDDGEGVTPEEREENINYLYSCLGSVTDATGTSGFDGTLTALEKAADNELFGDYPTENVGVIDECLINAIQPATMDEAFKRQQQQTNCKLQRAVALNIARQAEKVMTMIRESYTKNSIEGESKQFNNDRMRTKLMKASAKNVFGSGSVSMEYTEAGFTFPNFTDIFPSGGVTENDTLVVQVRESTNNPLRYTKTAKAIPSTSRFVSLDLFLNAGDKVNVTNMAAPLLVTIPRASDQPRLASSSIDPKLASWNLFQLHKTQTTVKGSSLHVTICPQNSSVQYVVVVNMGVIPDPAQGLCNKSFLVPPSMSATKRAECTNLMLDNYEVKDYIGDVFIGVRQLELSEHDMDVSNCSQLPKWEKNAANATQFTGNYTIKMFASGCFSISDGETDWSTQSCRVHENTNEVDTVCECNHLTTFAGGWVVVPNTIDWDYVFNNFDFYKNPTLYITEIVIIVVYILAVIWARRKDQKDVQELGIAPLSDNDTKDKYYYEIVVVTGMRRNAGTHSKVFFILSGEDDETDVREFSDNKRKIFRRGNTNGFLMATPRPLGYLNYARVWHDNSGKGNMGSWYMNYMIVRDVQTDEKWVFIADKWFAVEEDDGQVDRIIPAATRENMTDFSYMFAERSRKNLADGHLWFSVVARPPASRFTCVQRVSCCLCLLSVSMLANAMFYNTSTENSGSPNALTFGPFSVSPEQIFIGVISNLIVFPVNFIVITLFRKSRPRKLRPSRVDEAIKNAHDMSRNEASVTDVKPEVSSIFSVSRPASMMAASKTRPESSLSRPGTSLSTRADATLPTKKKKSKSLPWWCRIVAWVLLWVATLVSLAFVTFYGISFADETCKKWISSMLISFFMSVFITQPIKVFLIAIFLSLIIKNPGEEEDEDDEHDEERTKLANDEIPLHDLSSDAYGAARPRKIGYKPPDRSTLEAARARRLNEIQMWAIVREVVIYSFFLWILLVISYRQRNSDTFLYKDTMERVYIKNNETNIDFEKIRNVDEYWTWARSGLVNGIRAGPYYNDYPPLLLRGYVNDKVSKILGYAIMRQLRIRPSLCEMDERMMEVIRECNAGYDISDQDEETYDIGWVSRTVNSTVNDTQQWYKYTHADVLDGYPYWGQLALYAGGGYLVPLKGSKTDLISVMNMLEQEKWIDRYTRAIFVEFTTYNAQVNLFGIATILAEFHPTGGVVQSYRFEPAMLLPYMTSAMLFQLVCEGVYCCFIIFFIVKLLRTFFKEKAAFFKCFWNLVEIGIVAMSLSAIIIYFYRLFETNKLTSRFKETEGLQYIKFQYVGYWNELFTYMVGWTVFFATLKFLRLLRFNKRMSILASVLKNSARSLLHFSVIFWIVFLAFAMLFYLSYMTIDQKYSSFVGSMVSGILMMMGKFDIYQMSMAEPILTQIFVFLFVVAVTFIIVNMFVSILNETFSSVREDVNKQSNDYEIISFMISRFKHFTGIGGGSAPTTLTPEEMRDQELERRYAEGRGNTCVDDFPERIDRLLHSISNVYMNQDHMAAMLDKKGYQHGAGAKGYDNMGFVGPKGRASEMAKVHTH